MFTCYERIHRFVKIREVRKIFKSKIVFIDKQYKYFKGSIKSIIQQSVSEGQVVNYSFITSTKWQNL